MAKKVRKIEPIHQKVMIELQPKKEYVPTRESVQIQ